jgi:hypothetical protein
MAIGLSILLHTLAIILGSALGIGISFIVNCTLVEIANNNFFAIVFINNISIFQSFILL